MASASLYKEKRSGHAKYPNALVLSRKVQMFGVIQLFFCISIVLLCFSNTSVGTLFSFEKPKSSFSL